MINRIRYYQQSQQAAATIAHQRGGGMAIYKSRDIATGERRLEGADGSPIRARLLSNSVPEAVPPLVVHAGLVPQILQRPA